LFLVAYILFRFLRARWRTKHRDESGCEEDSESLSHATPSLWCTRYCWVCLPLLGLL
jgi:hypothetical protein